MFDLRSDTVTKPSKEMLKTMFHAEVGDDVFGEDPTINRLESMGAEMMGHEAGLFCPSGTMTNQIAISIHTKPGDEVICHESSHIYNYEVGGIARNSLSSVKLVFNDDAILTPEEVEDSILADHDWLARTSLVVAEDTSNRGGGKCYEFEQLKALSGACKKHKLAFHLDGARAFNAIVEKGHDLASYGQLFDSLSICLSKGLGAPVGSLLLGSKSFIKEARRRRKGMGGGMRQAGYLAMAGIYALENNVARLQEDHDLAKEIAETLKGCSKVVRVIEPETNILIFDVDNLSEVYLAKLELHNVRGVSFGKKRIRLVTHMDIDRSKTDDLKESLKRALN
ncbi:beta-eliminating lyase-related protein [Cryomorphaceae bacterium 1068]|nr:beta-eliminating lyase-related protein [Cryomorphaceae bacterium 1068]